MITACHSHTRMDCAGDGGLLDGDAPGLGLERPTQQFSNDVIGDPDPVQSESFKLSETRAIR